MIPRHEGPARIPAARKAMMSGWRSLRPATPEMAARTRMAVISKKLPMVTLNFLPFTVNGF